MEFQMFNESTNDTVASLVPVQWSHRPLIQLLLAIVGIVGNSAVIHVYLHTPKLTQSVTCTNRFIAALAVADLMTSICIIPIPTLSNVPENFGGHFYCRVVFSSFIMWISVVASIFSLVILAVERYVAIAHPRHYPTIFSAKMSKIMIMIIWLFSLAFNTYVLYVNDIDNNNECSTMFSGRGFQSFIGLSVFLVQYLLPITIMLATNIRSIQVLKVQAQNETSYRQKRESRTLLEARQSIIYMLLVVIISFIIAWSPDQIAYLVYNLGGLSNDYLHGVVYRAFVVLAFSNSCINPFLYALTNVNFRHAIKRHVLRQSVLLDKAANGLFETKLETDVLSYTATEGLQNLSCDV